MLDGSVFDGLYLCNAPEITQISPGVNSHLLFVELLLHVIACRHLEDLNFWRRLVATHDELDAGR